MIIKAKSCPQGNSPETVNRASSQGHPVTKKNAHFQTQKLCDLRKKINTSSYVS